MNALSTMKNELERVQIAQDECMGDYGYVKPSHRYRYQLLCRKAKSIQEAIDYLEEVYTLKERYELNQAYYQNNYNRSFIK